MSETPAEAGRRWASEHTATRPLQQWQIDEAARILAEVVRERMEREATEQLLTTRQVADRLGYSSATVSRNASKIPGARKVFGRWRFDPDVLEAWIASQQQAPDPWAAPRRGSACA